MKLKSGAWEEFKLFSQFQSNEEFRHHMAKWMLDGENIFTKGEWGGFHLLAGFSEKIPGICHLSIAEMVGAIQESDLDYKISRDTFKRMIKKAKVHEILKVYETVRENGSQANDLYVFQRYTKD
jgi:hypothetical protein